MLTVSYIESCAQAVSIHKSLKSVSLWSSPLISAIECSEGMQLQLNSNFSSELNLANYEFELQIKITNTGSLID